MTPQFSQKTSDLDAAKKCQGKREKLRWKSGKGLEIGKNLGWKSGKFGLEVREKSGNLTIGNL